MEKQISCAICFEIFASGEREPVMLPECGHTVCRHCLANLHEVMCPFCKKYHTGKPVGDLPVNYALLGVADMYERKSLPLEQTTIDAINERSLILSKVYLALKHSLTMDEGSRCRNVYSKKLYDILRGGGSISELEDLKMQMSPPDDMGANSAEKRKRRGLAMETVCCLALNSDGRKAKIGWEDGNLNLCALCDADDIDAHIILKMADVLPLVPRENPTVFMDMATATGKVGRIYIKVWSHLRRGQHFLALCRGHLGYSFRESSFLNLIKHEEIPCLTGGFYLTENGPVGEALMDDLQWDEGHQWPGRKGLVIGWKCQEVEHQTTFAIVLENSSVSFPCCFGEVVSGMSVVEKIAARRLVAEPKIVEVGIVIPEFVTDHQL
ncbi:uncharacterized protein [Penaeus vannamei]|uniref:uncharacterized protein isoform X3 n=1 Tax=Penaeus vannamei TaxID=6689 RepID=UPI00387F5699